MSDTPFLLPVAASSVAPGTDHLFLTLVGVAGTMALALTVLAIVFCVRYRRGSTADRSRAPDHANGLEWTWTIAPLLIFIGLFLWGAYDYAALTRAPAGAMPVYVVAKQWVWTLEHEDGTREIDELHVPVGQPVRLLMTSQDVIHSFYVPAFRIKQDVVPGRYTAIWFTATKAGTYHLLCAEFCGTDHASMGGGIVAMPPEQYRQWAAQGRAGPDLAERGYRLFSEHGCAGCHDARSTVHAPDLTNLFGRRVFLQDGRVVVADETYIRDSILEPGKDVVAGYAPVMPSFAGQFSESDLMALVQYLRSNRPKEAPPR
ncbi:cytochrome c oxidase subunit II [Bordetella genomosp. 10]|uniref:Cytochrome c oxidase subunit 2 n=1 Tax=Bordetella genomosp. 10 TaxID=1416804 RepID=A0A261SBS5_9BORD|nr:cytochrome c oxidase subunit II [Bordetella genomosp. 10]OZI34806.1 cytochrome c oxidase subunit II [Bordetella genomosp. 10]